MSETALDYRMGWRLSPAGGGGFELNLDAVRREAVNDSGTPDHGVMLRGAIAW